MSGTISLDFEFCLQGIRIDDAMPGAFNLVSHLIALSFKTNTDFQELSASTLYIKKRKEYTSESSKKKIYYQTRPQAHAGNTGLLGAHQSE